MKPMVRKLVSRMMLAVTDDEWNTICGEVNKLFESEKITWEDHELLFQLIDRVWIR